MEFGNDGPGRRPLFTVSTTVRLPELPTRVWSFDKLKMTDFFMKTETELPYTDPGALLQARVLKILKPCLEYWLDEQTLYLTLNLSRPPVTRVLLDVALRELRDKAYLDFRVDPLSRLTEWRLTPSGRALAQPL
jgi:hypothetical protein